ncbi:hypothetical protein [Psychroserpens luteus]|uniref:Haem-binding uptake Tiki superfamily ChaN domain-containing protein n=1 Tax=Psychroserpens luteus TaxID=1434066 RepID=A0ABW5ZVS2_9FLAO|nr:hypothetical protein [Psychroserpens luteus]
MNNKSWDVSTFNSFYESDKNTLDIIFIGSSHLNKGVDTYIIDANCKTNSVKISGGGMTIAQMYYNLKEVLNSQNPNLVVMETYTLIEPKDTYNKLIDDNDKLLVKPYNAEYYKRFGLVKYEEISKTYPDSKLYNMFNSFRFNDVWTDGERLSASTQAKLSLDPKKINQDYNKKLSFISDAVIEQYNNKEFSTKKFFLSENEKLYLNKIIELSKIENFELLFFTTPILDAYYKNTEVGINKVSSQLNKLFKSHDNVKYYDINQEVKGYDKTRFLPGTMNHNQHLNYKGIINNSNLLSKFIKNNYKFDTDSGNRTQTIEDILYNNRKIEKDSTFFGNIIGINNFKYRIGDSLTNTISVPRHQKNISIKGWMFKEDLNLKRTTRKLALKKKNNFIVISEGNLKNRENKSISERFRDNYKMSGFQFNFNRQSIEKGKYKIYNIIESDKGEIFVKDMWKWLIIE